MWPDFFIVGAPRSATTAMATWLDDHPDVVCEAGGPHYYEADQDPDVPTTVDDADAYRTLFEGAEEARRVGEKSVWYLRDPGAPKRIREDVPDADVLVQLRDPVEMVASLHARRVERCDEPVADLTRALEIEPARRRGEATPEGLEAPATVRYTDAARYATHLERWFDAFGRDQVHVLLHDDLVADPAAAYDDVLAFLGLEQGHRPSFDRVRPRRRVRSQALHRLLCHPPAPLARLGDLLPGGARRRAAAWLREANLDGAGHRGVDPEAAARIRDALRDEVRRLERLLGRDLSGWLEPDKG